MPAASPDTRPDRPGVGVDSKGGAVIDPTENVIALTKAEAKRQDDLREANNTFLRSQVDWLEKLIDVREKYSNLLAEKESARLDAIRQVDVLAVTTAADRALAATQTLATSTKATVDGINERVAAVEKASYEGAGKSGGIGASWSVIVTVVMTLLAIGSFLYAINRTPAQPQVIYLPSPVPGATK